MNSLCQHLISVSFYRSLLAKEFLSLAFLCGYLYSSMPVLVTMHNPFTFHTIVGPSLQIIGFIPFPRAFKKSTPTYFLAWQIVQILAWVTGSMTLVFLIFGRGHKSCYVVYWYFIGSLLKSSALPGFLRTLLIICMELCNWMSTVEWQN